MEAEDLEGSSSDDNSTEDETDNAEVTRVRRGINWCGVEDEPSTSSSQSVPKFYFQGNPKFGNRMQLYSRTNYFLAIYPDGIRGTRDSNDLHTHFEIINAGDVGDVRLQHLESDLCIAMTSNGDMYPTNEKDDCETVFLERGLHGAYKTFMSKKYQEKNYYIGIKKNGQPKNGQKTALSQKPVQFISSRKKFDDSN